MSIKFPNPGDPGYPDGITCEIYEYGFTSECLDDDGNNRGFTQEWYFDEVIGAWVSVTKSGTDPSDILGDGYTGFTHASPEYVAGTTGIIRKVSFLDPDTGSLTFDYIRLYDLVGPNEAEHRFSGSWLSARNNIFDSQGNPRYRTSNLSQNGITLCAPSGYTYSIGSSTVNTDTGIRVSFNVQDNGEVSPFGEDAPSIANIEFAGSGTSVTGDASFLGVTLPYAFSPINGVNNIEIDDLNIGFTTDSGPANDVAFLRALYDRPTDPVTPTNKALSNRISTENEYYIFLSGTADGTYFSTGAEGATDESYLINTSAIAGYSAESGSGNIAGLIGILPRAGANTTSNHSFVKEFTLSDFNLTVGTPAPGTIYLAIPSRVNLQSNQIFQNPGTIPGPAGFTDADLQQITITNDYGYGEEYDLFKSNNGNGFDTTGVTIFKIAP